MDCSPYKINSQYDEIENKLISNLNNIFNDSKNF